MRMWLLRLGIVTLMTMALPGLSYGDVHLTFFDSTDMLTVGFQSLPPMSCGVTETCNVTVGLVQFVSPGVDLRFNIFDPNSVTRSLSDTLQIVSAAGTDTFVLTFKSDVEGVPLSPLLNATSVVEDGTVQTEATIPLNGGFAGQNFIVSVQSDVETAAPEPSSIQLLALGLLGIAIVAKRVERAKGGRPK